MRPAVVLLALLAGAGATPATAATADPAFATPAGLERDVAFWTRVYTDVRTTAGLLHDDRNLAVVYEVLVFPDGLGREGRARMVEQARARYVRILRTLAEGKRDGLTAEEARVLALWGDNVQARTLELAVDRIRFQLGQSDRFQEGLTRAARWEKHLAATFAASGLPGELASLPHVESSFNPRAGSKVGAAGLWQFMPSTGRRWLRVDSVVDERYDPYKSTVAAAQYLQLNYSVLGTWPLALTAYNHGASGMRRAKEMMGTDDIVTIVRYYTSPSFGFASRNFYVSFLAALDVDRHAERYFGPFERDPLDDSVIVPLPAYIPVAALERAFAIDRDDLQNLNPALRGAVWSGRRSVPKGFELRVPPRDGLDPAALLSGLRPTDRQAAQASDAFHTVRRGETLGGIAAKHGVSQAWLVRHNDLKAGGRDIRVGQVLRLPGRMPVVPVPAEPAAAGDLYVVARGDTLSEIAQKTGLTERDLMERNSLKDRDSLFVGQRLRLVAAVPTAPRADEEAGELLAEERRAESEAQVTRREEEQLLTSEQSSDPGTQPAAGAMSADPSDYSVSPDGSIIVAGAETLGHLADWLGIRAQRLRELNGMKQGQALSAGRRLKLDLSVVDAATFEKRRTAYHRELQEQFFSAWRVVGTERHTVRSGESLWTLTQRRRNLPVWLLRQYNPEVNLEELKPGTQVTLPKLEAANGQAG